jgi:hypothetical protein
VAVDEGPVVAGQEQRRPRDVLRQPERRKGFALVRLLVSLASFASRFSASIVEAWPDPPKKIGVAMAPGEMLLTVIP